MRTILLALLTTSVAFAGEPGLPTFDPYREVVRSTEKNGLTVVYAPSESARTFRMTVSVKAGHGSEDRATAGISHLLEHYLFTDAKLEKDMTYLEVIREKGGEANGHTEEAKTTYEATVPPVSSQWLVQTFFQMLMGRSFNDEDLRRVKKPLFLEIGPVSPFDPLLDAGIYAILFPEFLNDQDFWKSEFGFDRHHEPHHHVRMNTVRLRAADLERYYREYYRPSNTTLYVSGKFDPKVIRPLIAKLYGGVPDWAGKTMPEKAFTIRERPYVRTQSTSEVPAISVGTKLVGVTPAEEMTARVYLKYFAHRLMKEMRNTQGDTYTASDHVSAWRRHGYATVGMQAASETYGKNLKTILDRLEKETVDGEFTRAQYDEAIKLYASEFNLRDLDSDTMERLGKEIDQDWLDYGTGTTPYAEFQHLNYAAFRAGLAKLFEPKRRYTSLVRPPIFFRYDEFLFFLAFMGLVFFGSRRFLSPPFDHAKIHFMRKLSSPPMYFAEFAVVALSAILSRYLTFGVEAFFEQSPLLQSNVLTASYLQGFFMILAVFSACILGLSLLVKKLTLSGDYLYLKSATFIATRIPLADISSIETISPFRLYGSPKLWWAVKWRYRDYTPYFPTAGLLIRLRDGRAHYLHLKESKLAKFEIDGLMGNR